MSKKSLNRGPVLMIALLVIGIAVAPLAADPPTKADVEFMIKKSGNDYELRVGPRGVGICKNTNKCDDFLTFEWKGHRRGYDKITVTALGNTKVCLDPYTIELTDAADKKSAYLDKDACAALCEDKKKEMEPTKATESLTDGCKLAVFYEVKAVDAEGNKPDLIVDPGVIIDQ